MGGRIDGFNQTCTGHGVTCLQWFYRLVSSCTHWCHRRAAQVPVTRPDAQQLVGPERGHVALHSRGLDGHLVDRRPVKLNRYTRLDHV